MMWKRYPVLKAQLANEFEIKDLGPLRYTLGIHIAKSDKGIFIPQRKYILDLLEETNTLGCKLVNLPIKASNHFSGDVGKPIDKKRYQRLVV